MAWGRACFHTRCPRRGRSRPSIPAGRPSSFILGVMVVPTALALLWIGILGGNAIHLELNAAGGVGTAGIIELMQDANYEAALYVTIDLLSDIDWLTWAMSALATLLRATWFITSSDVITTLLSMGDPPPRCFRVVWGLGVGVVAAVLLLADGLQALQTAAMAAALPVTVILLLDRRARKVPSAGSVMIWRWRDARSLAMLTQY